MNFFYSCIFYFICFILIVFSSIASYSYYSNINFSNSSNNNFDFYFSNNEFFWPIPGFNTITSSFGKRVSPTTGASSNHSGIDIKAPEGTKLFSAISGTISFTGFQGANGYSIILVNENISIIYAHVSPNYIVSIGEYISKGKMIGTVGPKYISDVSNNPYSDSNGKPTNGATTGPHLHFGIKKDGNAINPITFFD